MPPPPYLSACSLLFGTVPLVLGLNALFRPVSGLAIFQFPIPTDPYARRLSLGLMRVYGSRNAVMGLSVLTMWYYGQTEVIGLTFLAGCTVTVTDGFVAREVIGAKEWTHWRFTPLGLVLGVLLLMLGGER